MSQSVLLTGIAWDHSRAFPPLLATAQRYEETHPGIRIRWEKRALDEFGHMPLDQLAHKFDLIVIDHPWAGFAFERNLVHDLKPLLSPAALNEYAQNSIGATFESYCYAGRLLALPIDAAAPAPSWRCDLMERAGLPVPATWAEAIALARRRIAVLPAFNADLFLHFLMLLKALGSNPCTAPDQIAPRHATRTALNLLRELTEPMPRAIFDWNPIQIAERMAATDDFAWNAFAYTYNNYARDGFARHRLRFGNLISLEPNAARLRSALGGTGIALTTKCNNMETTLDYACFVAGGITQRTLYANAGGQPSHRAAWNDPSIDVLCGGFFSGTRTTQEEAFIRPRYSGYVPLQTCGGKALQETLRDGRDAEPVLEKLDALYRESRQAGSPSFNAN
ncbi:MAG TPA: ABC transporter substrate-binding protein [Candidatus Binatia bacterium]|jgi:multiple sugar transport system substrate-binding protein|nr:ABC transporter substrate-binding protein [Candidatus Binatia bacterium]